MPELLLEILSEEIPARMQALAAAQLREALLAELTQLRFESPVAADSVETHVTPRRLVGVVSGLPTQIPAQKTTRRGPKVGAPARAVDGFARSAGCSPDDLQARDVDGGTYYFAEITAPAQATAERLEMIVQRIVSTFSWPKSMRWNNGAATWVRPVHAILCVFDGQAVPGAVEFASTDGGPALAVPLGNATVGHRFLAPAEIRVAGFAAYEKHLRSAKVILRREVRQQEIESRADALAAAADLKVRRDPALLAEVTGLVEWPVPLMGTIDPEYLELPPEVLVTAMRSHQKYFATEDGDGRLADKFVVVAGTEARDGGKAIVAGNERVLRARLSDAKFFWDQDRKIPLAARAPALKDIVFHAKLGTLDEKTDRTQALAVELCRWLPGADRDRVRSAARLAKADLTTGMVGEFPELQGVMGGYYARADGEADEVAVAVAEHHAPKGPGDLCPSAPVSVAVALADKIDTLAQFWTVGERPTGSKDPFALRRAALGAIRLVLENDLRLPLLQAFTAAGASDEIARSLLEFFADRLKVHLRDRGVRHDLVAAAFFDRTEDDLVRLLARVDALAAFLDSEDGADLLVAYRRAANIVRIEEKKDGVRYREAWDASVLTDAAEKQLASALDAARGEMQQCLDDERFGDAMRKLAGLRVPLDLFFEGVVVNVDAAELRTNRLHLLSQVTATLELVAGFSEIEG